MKPIETTLIPIARLERNTGQIDGLPENPRQITERDFKKLLTSIKTNPEMLNLRELVVFQIPDTEKYAVIGGNMRLEALKHLNRDKTLTKEERDAYSLAPCKIIPPETPIEKLQAFTLLDNSSFGDWDLDLLANWDVDLINACCIEIPPMPEQKEEKCQEDDFDENVDTVETRSASGDIWQLGRHRLMCGDSLDAEQIGQLTDGKQADCWLTDPPYNVAIENSQGKKIQNDNMGSSQFLEFLTKAFTAAAEWLKAGAPFYVWYASREHLNFETAMNNAGLKVRQQLIWNKSSLVLGRQDYQWKHEPCLYGWKDGSAHYFCDSRCETTVIPDGDQIDIDHMKKEDMRDLLKKLLDPKRATSVLDFPKPAKDDEHPTMKPVELFGYQMRNSTKRGFVVLDTFGGSGTSIIAAEQLNRTCYMMELDPHYCDVILARWEKFTGLKAERITNINETA